MTVGRLNKKGLTSFFMTFGFILLLVTGIILYIVPAGRIANWVNWTLLGLTKTQWGNIHVLSGFMLMIAGGFHIYFNWKPLKHYFYSRVSKGFNLKKEMILSTVATAVLVGSAIGDLPPFGYIFDFGDYAKESWVVEKTQEPPVGHAELLSFSSFTKRLDIDKNAALQVLAQHEIKMGSESDSLEKIAKANNISPLELYQMVQHLAPEDKMEATESWTLERVENELEGKGVGRKNIKWLIDNYHLEMSVVQNRLKKSGIVAESGETFHDIADRYQVSPLDIVKKILVENLE